MANQDIRWQQRFSNFKKAMQKLNEVVTTRTIDQLSELEREGLIQRFEYTYELAWKTLQDLLRMKGYVDIAGPNPVIAQAFQDGYLENGEVWKKMKLSRELSSHTNDETTAEDIAESISSSYYYILKDLQERLEKELGNRQG